MAGGRKREWIRKRMAMVAASSGSRSPQWTRRVRGALTTALRHPRSRLSRVDLLRLFYENVVFRLLWVIESLVVIARLCFFFLRFGFRL
ncbi:unnamed protein product [Alopecurus aequalis]